MNPPEIAKNLKIQRHLKNWSLSKTATITGVSKAMLGQIERGESSPTIATLWKIASGFNLPLTIFFEHSTSLNEYIHFKDSIRFKTLFAFDPILNSEMFEHYIDPHQSHLSAAHNLGVIEDIVVLTGQIEILTNQKWVLLNKGEALRFAADAPHGYRNPTSKLATFHNIMHYPNGIEK